MAFAFREALNQPILLFPDRIESIPSPPGKTLQLIATAPAKLALNTQCALT